MQRKVFERSEYNTETGEIIKSVSIVKKVTNVEHFVQTYCDDLGTLLKCTKGQIDLLVAIINSKFMEFDSNEVILNSNRRNIISEKTGLSLSSIYNLTNGLKKKNILVEDKGRLYLNPKLFFYGSELARQKMSKKFTETLTIIPDDVLIKYTQQETLEEAAKDYIENTMRFSFNSMETKTQANRMLKCVEFGAKWQQEQYKNKYSEEDLRNAYRWGNYS